MLYIFILLALGLSFALFYGPWAERIIAFQNRAEAAFQEKKNLSTTFWYILAFLSFMLSTLLAQIRLPFAYIWKSFRPQEPSPLLLDIKEKDFYPFVKKSKKKVLVDVWAEWCGPCVMMEPMIRQFAEKYQEDVQVLKLNASINPKLLQELKIRGLPHILLFEKGEEVKRHAGPLNYRELEGFVG